MLQLSGNCHLSCHVKGVKLLSGSQSSRYGNVLHLHGDTGEDLSVLLDVEEFSLAAFLRSDLSACSVNCENETHR